MSKCVLSSRFNRSTRVAGARLAGTYLLAIVLSWTGLEVNNARAEEIDPALAKTAVPTLAAKNDSSKINYPLSAADVVQITVFQEDDLKSVLRVSNEGTITFPLIGVVSVAGKSAQEAGLAIADKLRAGYLINPQVAFTVISYAKRRFTVLGQVQKPGSFDIPDQDSVTLLQALGMAGGYTRIADATKITVVRHLPEGESKTFQVNAKKMAGGGDQAPFAILPNDVVTVAESIF